MYIRHSYESEFEHLYLDLKDKYPKQIFQLEGIDESQLDVTQFSKNYFLKKNVADASIDQNANVQIKTVATYKSEVHKGEDKLNSLYLIWKTAKKLYGTRIANRLIEEEVCKDLNIQDSSNSFLPYCFAFDTIDVVTNGLPFITNMPSGPAKHADTFLRHCEQLIMFASHQLMGATAIPNALVIYSALLKIDSLDDTYPVYNYKTQPEMFDKYIRQEFQKFIYTLNQPIRQIQCVDEETEVLTPSGFKDYKSLNVNDDIYTWDNGALNVQKVDAVNVYDYDGEMHIYEGRDIFQQVSPDHRVLYKKFNTSDFELKQSKDLIEFKTPIDIPIVPSIVKIEDYSISDNDIIMSVFILTDGCFIKRKDGSRRTYIQIFKSDNRWGGEELEKILNEENIEYKKSYRKSGFEADGYNAEEHKVGIYSISTESSQKYVELLNENKSDIPDIFLNMSQRQSKLFIDTWSKLDGSIVNDRDKLQCDNYNIADKIQHICFRAGIGSRIAPRLIGNNKKETVYVLLYKNTIKSASKKYKIDYKGKIWCPTTNDGVVFFRKNGKIFVSGNSAFTNITIFDSIFLKELCKMYVIGGDPIDPEFAMFVQKKFLQFFNEFNRERIFTFPVLTVQFKKDFNNELEDKEFFEYICDVNTEFANLNIFSASNLTALSSCCRLINNIEDLIQATKEENMNLIGGSSIKVGSFGVTTLNLPRIAIKSKKDTELFFDELRRLCEDAFMINNCRRELIIKMIEQDQLPLYSSGFMNLDNQYSTLGILGIFETVEIMGFDNISCDGKNFAISILKFIDEIVKNKIKKYGYRCNVEQIPAEATSPKLAKVDKILYKQDKYKLYSNQFLPLTTETDILNRIELQELYERYFSGGTILHVNVANKIKSKRVMKKLMEYVIKSGVQYFAVNYFFQKCKNGHLTIDSSIMCNICGGEVIERYTRIVGFLTPVSSWQEERREEFYDRKRYSEDVLPQIQSEESIKNVS
jgi:ribonucleoside-triphosphate reductase